jgi:hypothetical protein
VSQPDLTQWMDRTPNHTVVIEDSQHNQRVERAWIPDHRADCYCKNLNKCAQCSWLGYAQQSKGPLITICLRIGKERSRESLACILFMPAK